MDSRLIISNLLTMFNKKIHELSNDDLKQIENGNYEIILNIKKEKKTKSKNDQTRTFNDEFLKNVLNKLDSAISREEGIKVIEKELKNKKELELFARYIDVAFLKSDRVDKIRSNIVDATVGARLRSEAIQDKKI